MSDIPRKRQTKKPDLKKEDKPKRKPHSGDFKPGNQIWMQAKLMGKSGRKRIHETASDLFDEAMEYFEWSENNPIQNYIISAGKRILSPLRRPFTLHGLCVYMGVNTRYITDIEERALGKTDPTKPDYSERESDFSQVCFHIREIIYQQKYEGAAVGQFKENLIARDIGLHESVNNKLYSGNDEPLKSQISIIQLPDNGRPVNIPGITKEE